LVKGDNLVGGKELAKRENLVKGEMLVNLQILVMIEKLVKGEMLVTLLASELFFYFSTPCIQTVNNRGTK